MIYIYLVLVSLFSGFLYHIGGCGEDGIAKYPRLPKWLFGKVNSKIRDVGCSAVSIFTIYYILGINYFEWWVYFLTFGLQWGALSTYCKIGKQKDVHWYNWLLTGFLYGLSGCLYHIEYGGWDIFFIRSISLAIAICIWSILISKAWKEEGGRGIIFNISTVFLLWT